MNEDNCSCSKTDDSCGLIAENGSTAMQKVVVCDNRTMCILDELNHIYEERLIDIDQQTDGSYELKYLTYKEWVEMLIKLMKDLIDVVHELEYEASNRIELLEKKLQIDTAPCNIGDIAKLRNDVANLLELIRRAVDDGSWNLDGLEFSTFKANDIFGQKMEPSDSSSTQTCRLIQETPYRGICDVKALNSQVLAKNHEIKRLESDKHTLNTEIQRKDLLISKYLTRINKLEKDAKPQQERKRSVCCEQEETLTSNEEDELFKVCIAELKDCLRQKEYELDEKTKQNECLQNELRLIKTQAAQKDKAVTNMRALAFEVAEKHDQILQMRCQVTSLEEELKKAHKKIQFKDNVIRELRRECKGTAKSVSPARTITPTRCECGKSDLEFDRLSFKSVGFTEPEVTQRSDYTMCTVIDAEILKLRSSVHADEERNIQILRDELDELFRFQGNQNDAIEDQKKIMITQHNKLRDLVNRLLGDLVKSRSKLYYVRNQLNFISGDSETSHSNTKKADSGYISPEELEPEYHIIESVRSCVNGLKEENDSLKVQLQKLNADMLSATSSVCDKSAIYGYNERILHEVASALSNICGKEIHLESGLESCEGEIHPICQAMMSLEAELNEKDEAVRNSKDIMAKTEAELKSIKLKCFNLEEECDNKNHTISQLQEAVDFHEHSINRLEKVKENLEAEMNRFKRMPENSEYKALQDAKNKLEIECQNQLTTINNLRQALEDFKKNGNSQQSSSSPVICTDMEHDILMEQLAEMFGESMRLERILLQLRDENLCLKELLVDTECDFQSLERKYLKISNKVNDTNEIEHDFKQLNDRSIQLHREIEIRGGEQLYVNCFRHIRAKMEKECRKRLNDQEQKYREIIDDLTNELSSLSDQVQIAQAELNHDDITASFDASFRELESQNDLLQKTIEKLETKICGYESCLKDNEVEILQLHARNAQLQGVIDNTNAKFEDLWDQYQSLVRSLQAIKVRCKCGAGQMAHHASFVQTGHAVISLGNQNSREIISYKSGERSHLSVATYDLEDQVKQMEVKISILEKTLDKREQDLRETNARLLEFAQRDGELTCQLVMHQDEVFYLRTEEDRMKNTIDRQSRELAELKIIRRERETNLMSELNLLRQAMEEHVKALSKANDTIHNLERQTNSYRKQGDTANKENAMLKAEIFKLKESMAAQDGIEKSLRSQLMKTQSEVSTMRCDLEHYTSLLKQIEILKKHCSRLKDSNYELVRKYNDLVEDYNNLEEEYRKLIEIKDQAICEVEATRKWQQCQTEQDRLISVKIQKLEEHVNTLLDDRKKLIVKINELHRDTVLISGELCHYKEVRSGSLSDTQERRISRFDLDNQSDNVDMMIRKIRRVARKLSQTRSIWQDGIRRFSD